MTNPFKDIQTLRAHMRSERAALSAAEHQNKSNLISKKIIALPQYRDASSVALYLAARGEVSTQELIRHALGQGKKVYLPVLDKQDPNQMSFVEYGQDDPLVENRFGMLEPRFEDGKVISAMNLDLVLCPLVAFDENANRIGMGGGFYDRHFAFKNEATHADQAPYMIGLAYELQRLDAITPEHWDVSLNAIATEEKVYYPRKNC